MMYRLNHILDISLQPDTIKTSIKVALFVGVILNMINQGDLILTLNFQEINLVKLIITFFVPFGVSTYSTIKAKLDFRIGDKSALTTELNCESCQEEHISIKKNEIIPLCPSCGHATNWQLDHGSN